MKQPTKIKKIKIDGSYCKKVSFATKKDADWHIQKKSQSDNAKPAQSYLCHRCNAWHITSWINEDFVHLIKQLNIEIEAINKQNDEMYIEATDAICLMNNILVDLKKGKI